MTAGIREYNYRANSSLEFIFMYMWLTQCQTNIVQEQGGVIRVSFNGLIHLGNETILEANSALHMCFYKCCAFISTCLRTSQAYKTSSFMGCGRWFFFFPFAARVELSCFWTKGFGVPCFLGDLYPTDAFRYLVLKYTHIWGLNNHFKNITGIWMSVSLLPAWLNPRSLWMLYLVNCKLWVNTGDEEDEGVEDDNN